MNMHTYFAALVSFDPDMPSRKTYQVVPVSKERGNCPVKIADSFAQVAEMGFVYEAADLVDAQYIADTMLVHPSEAQGIKFFPSAQLNERHANLG
jgi:hypothetical protein